MSSIQNLFYRAEDSTRRTSQFISWLQSLNWRDDEEEEDDEQDNKKSVKSKQ